MYQGTLYKWTNYISGWQPRWFVLDSGILSYYYSQEQVKNGSRGSFKVAMCNVQAHPSDSHQIMMTTKSEACLYVRTSTPEDRQKWLVEMGKAKQIEAAREGNSEQTDGEDLEMFVKRNMAALRMTCKTLVEQITVVKQSCAKPQSVSVQTLEKSCSLVQSTCDKFVDQLACCMEIEESMSNVPLKRTWSKSEEGSFKHKFGPAVPTDLFYPNSSTPGTPSSPSTHSLPLPGSGRVTSHTHASPKQAAKAAFEFSRLSVRNFSAQEMDSDDVRGSLEMLSVRSSSGMPAHLRTAHSTHSGGRSPRTTTPSPSIENVQGMISQEVIGSYRNHHHHHHHHHQQQQQQQQQQKLKEQEQTALNFVSDEDKSMDGQHSLNSSANRYNHFSRTGSEAFVTPTSSPKESTPGTPVEDDLLVEEGSAFQDTVEVDSEDNFVSLPFEVALFDFPLTASNEIPTDAFLKASRAMLSFLDCLNSSAMGAVKADIQGNISKLTVRFESDPTSLATLQLMVKSELDSQTHGLSGSVTDGLLWLRRTLDFAAAFGADVASGEQDMAVSAGKAYSDTLRPHHNWIVRGLFNLACQALPYRRDFILALAGKGPACEMEDSEFERLEVYVCKKIRYWAGDIEKMSRIICAYYASRGLEET